MNKLAICSVLAISAYSFAQPTDAPAAYQDIQKTLGFVPGFFKAFPEAAISAAWDEMKAIQIDPDTAIPVQSKQLIGLAVAAQIPCRYCVYFHTQLAKASGATDTMVKETIALASMTRQWSTILDGLQIDPAQFKREITNMMQYAAKHPVPLASPTPVTDAASAYNDIQRVYGMVPDFMRMYPREGIAAIWREFKDLALDPNTALSPKEKDLIGLAVSAQVPCTSCVFYNTEAARHDGANDAEIREAVALAAITRHWSTVLNGSLIDEVAFRRDVDRLVKGTEQVKKTARQP